MAPRRDSANDPARSVEDLVVLLEANSGTLQVHRPSEPDRRQWRRVIHAATVNGGLPDGTRLRFSGRDSGDMVIRLVPDTQEHQPRRPSVASVPVPLRLPAHPHSVVAATRASATSTDGWIDTRRIGGVAHLAIAETSLSRALRLLQGLLDEGERRGYPVTEAPQWGSCCGGIGLSIRGETFELVISEERRRTERGVTGTDPTGTGRWMPRWDYVPTGNLRLRVGHESYEAPLATDRTRWRIEERLGQAFSKLEAQAVERHDRRIERERATAQLERQMRSSRNERLRVDLLHQQVVTWKEAEDIRAFVTRARSAVDGPDPQLHSWLDWSEQYADRIDPMRHLAQLPPPDGPVGDA